MEEINPDIAARSKLIEECFARLSELGLAAILERISAQMEGLPVQHVSVASAWATSMSRLSQAAQLPYWMAWFGYVAGQHQRITTAAAADAALQLDEGQADFEEAFDRLKRDIAKTQLAELINSDAGRQKLHAGAIRMLAVASKIDSDAMIDGAHAMLGQAAIATWAALEAFVADSVRATLNQQPEYLRYLLQDEDAKKRITRVRLGLGDLLDLGLNLSDRLGDLILSDNDLSDYTSMKSILMPLLQRPTGLRAALDNHSLYILGKLRNVLVHRSGMADERFEQETSGRWKAGSVVTIQVADLANYISATGAVVEQVLAAVRLLHGLKAAQATEAS